MSDDALPLVVTGAASGIGRALCHRLATRGQPVISVDRDDLPDGVSSIAHHRCDLSDPHAVADLIDALDDEHDLGRCAGVANVAGVPGTLPADVVLEVNLLAVRRLGRAFAARLPSGATITNVGSISGNGWAQRLDTHRQILALDDDQARSWWADRAASVGVDPYSFSKEAVIVDSMLLAGELLGTGIRCNVVSPGPVETSLLPTFREQIGDERLGWVIGHAGRAAEPDEIAQGIEWLAVGESHWVNGHHLVIDGGYTSGLLSGWIDVASAPQPRQTYVAPGTN